MNCKESCKNYETKGKAEPKFNVGDEVWDGEYKVKITCYDSAFEHPYHVMMPNGVGYWAFESSLSPLPEMHVGKKWTLDQPGNPWHGFEVECVRENSNYQEYEQLYGTYGKFAFTDNYPDKQSRTYNHSNVIRCIDPRFWTGKIEGEKVRCYENEDKDLVVVIQSGVQHNIGDGFYSRILLAAIKAAGINIAPIGYFNEMIPPTSEE